MSATSPVLGVQIIRFADLRHAATVPAGAPVRIDLDGAGPDEITENALRATTRLTASARRIEVTGTDPNLIADVTRQLSAMLAAERMLTNVVRFLADECRIGTPARARVSEVRARYGQWCRENVETPLSAKAFTGVLRWHGVKSVRGGKGVRYYAGLTLGQQGGPRA